MDTKVSRSFYLKIKNYLKDIKDSDALLRYFEVTKVS